MAAVETPEWCRSRGTSSCVTPPTAPTTASATAAASTRGWRDAATVIVRTEPVLAETDRGAAGWRASAAAAIPAAPPMITNGAARPIHPAARPPSPGPAARPAAELVATAPSEAVPERSSDAASHAVAVVHTIP
ncbi:MAG TPA: hypothetical protein VMG37_04685 [Solirubrobacteraceae bacterium]|nr:hypothetical protein [Solirubrobacteraceae bacterium]